MPLLIVIFLFCFFVSNARSEPTCIDLAEHASEAARERDSGGRLPLTGDDRDDVEEEVYENEDLDEDSAYEQALAECEARAKHRKPRKHP